MNIYPYRTREVRDLAWACFSPPLLDTRGLGGTDASNCGFALSSKRQAWLLALDRDAAPLLDYLSALHSTRLGLYFEALWQFFLSQDEEVELVASNLPVHEGGRTVGEFDCLYFCRQRNCHVHLELAVKFYLGWHPGISPDGPGAWADWYGPGVEDRLDKKIDRLVTHQIRLGACRAAAPLFQSLGINRLAREIEVKGYLFTPVTGTLPPPPAFHRRRRLHPWVRIDDLSDPPRAIRASGYRVLPRRHWLSAARTTPGETLTSVQALAGVLERGMSTAPRPRLVAALDDNGREVERFFVTDAGWPPL